MCGRYALALRPSQIRRMMEDENMPVWEAPEDEGEGTPRQSYNFAPGYHGVVYRADVPDWGAGPSRSRKADGAPASSQAEEATDEQHPGGDGADDEVAAESTSDASDGSSKKEVKYRLQSMRWGLIPFWTKRNPDYASMLRTINCRDDSLSTPGGMWATMKARKRCVVVAQGFYEWLAKGPKEKVPHYIKRKDGGLLLMAGLWDCVQYEDSDQKTYTYTIITTDSNQQLKFLHDRMPVILEPGSNALRTWLDPQRHEWSRELQSLLKPFNGELEIYPVSKDVGKVGNNSPTFIVPIASRENKSNIANFFANAAQKKKDGASTSSSSTFGASCTSERTSSMDAAKTEGTENDLKDNTSSENEQKKGNSSMVETTIPKSGVKRGPLDDFTAEMPKKAMTSRASPKKISATSNGAKSPAKMRAQDGSQKITKFFGK